MNQTAVEWLVSELNQKIDFIPIDKWDMIRDIVQQAKEIEKEQQERMYSEEDMKQFAWECVSNFLSNNVNEVEMALVEVIIDRNNKKFEQFKKK